MSQEEAAYLGRVVAGSLSQGVEVRLDPSACVEDLKVGSYVVIQGQRRRFFGIVTDVSLASLDPQLTATPPDSSDPFLAQVLAGTSLYGKAQVLPQLVLDDHLSLLEGPQPARTVPAHLSAVHQASQADVERVFGREDDRHFVIGTPLDMEVKVCLDAPKFVQRSNGIFGKTGSGKTYFARLLLFYLLQKSQAVNLVFDMHADYGWEGTREGGYKAKGLKQVFGSKVALFALDEASARRRRVSVDHYVKVGYDQIEPEDIDLLRQSLGLTQLACDAVHQLARDLGRQKWLERLLSLDEEEAKALLEKHKIAESSYRNLRRGLDRMTRLPFLVERAEEDSVKSILGYLERGMHVVLEFGPHMDVTGYVLVANLLTRRIHASYRERTEQALGEDARGPRPLVITLEEAHRFLNPEVAGQTIFGTIAREMRKYNVTLLVIDQRPSGIDPEVMSQLGTRAVFSLDDERDIDSALAGAPGRSELKTVLARLESRQQALLFGHALPMPLTFRVRDTTTPQFYGQFGFAPGPEARKAAQRDVEELFP